MVTCAFEPPPQVPLVKVHWYTLTPTLNPVMDVLALFGEVMLPLPLTLVHVPVPGEIGALPVSVVETGEPV